MTTYNSLAHTTFGPVETPSRYYFAHVGPPAHLYGPYGKILTIFYATTDVCTGLSRFEARYHDQDGIAQRKYSYNLQELVDHVCRLHRLGLLK